MAEIRLNKIIRQFNIGLDDLVNFLQKIGVELDANPNAKIDESYMPAISKQFGKDLEIKQAADKVDIKIKEIIEKGRKQPKEEEVEDDQEHETIIKSNTLSGDKPSEVKKTSEVKASAEEEKSAPAEPVAPQKEEVTEPAPKVAEPEPKPEPEPEPEVKPEPEPVKVQEVKVEEVKVDKKSEPAKIEIAPAEKVEPKAVEMEKAVKIEPAEQVPGTQFKVVGKIDLSQFDRKPSKKRERVTKGTQKVDVVKAGAHVEKSQKKDRKQDQKQGGQSRQDQKARQNGAQPNNPQNPGKGRKGDRDRFKPAMTEAEQEEMQKEIQKQVKETYAKMNEGKKNNFGAKYRKEKREASAQKTQEELAQANAEQKILKVTEFVTVNDLATLMNNTPVVKVIGACMSLGLMVSINQRLDAETLVLVAEEFGYKVEFVTADISEKISST